MLEMLHFLYLVQFHSYKALLDAHQEPEMPEEAQEELDDFLERRVAEGGVETDY